MTYTACTSNIGLGLRPPHFSNWLSNSPCNGLTHNVGWAEVHPENYLEPTSYAQINLLKASEHWPISFHCTGFNLGGVAPLNTDYMQKLKTLVDRIDPILLSDHLSFTAIADHYSNDLLPLPYTEECLKHLSNRINFIQEFFDRQLIIENPSVYVDINAQHAIDEPDFLNALCERTGCGLLVDLNNISVNAYNSTGLDPINWLNRIEWRHVKELHLAAASLSTLETGEQLLIDDHSGPVNKELYDLLDRFSPVLKHLPTLIEWDTQLPIFDTLVNEANRLQHMREAERI